MIAGKIISGKLTKANFDDAGQDIHSAADYVIPPMDSVHISTGLRIIVPEGHVGLVWPRSGLSFKFDLETGAGVIDHKYTGEVKVHLYNHGKDPYHIKEDDKIAQLVTIPINYLPYVPATEEDIIQINASNNRKEKGFGSSGK